MQSANNKLSRKLQISTKLLLVGVQINPVRDASYPGLFNAQQLQVHSPHKTLRNIPWMVLVLHTTGLVNRLTNGLNMQRTSVVMHKHQKKRSFISSKNKEKTKRKKDGYLITRTSGQRSLFY